LEHLILDQPSQKVRISTWVYRILSDIGLLAQARDEFESFQPWVAVMDYEFEKVQDKLEIEMVDQFKVRAMINDNMESTVKGLGAFGCPVHAGERRFHYPSDKRRTRATTEAMRLAERNLDRFWTRFDTKYKSGVGKTINQTVEGFLFQTRDLQRTPEWAESEPKSKKITPEIPLAIQSSFSSLTLGPIVSTSPYVFSAPKPKVKTRGEATTSETSIAKPNDTLSEDVQLILYVDRRAHKVFKALFFSPKSVDLPGETPWVDFLHALASTGFRPEKLYGSVWQFTPTNLDVERSINFLEPHPHSKIPFQVARRIGRRLNRAYGWHSGMFVLV
jgi:hypothetical protein